MSPLDNYLALFLLLLPIVNSCSERKVVDHILSNYSQLVRPVVNQSTCINVSFELRVYNIIDLDEPNEAINLLLWTTAVWTDEFLSWNPSVMDGCTSIKIEAKKIWTPDIYFVNTLDSTPLATADMNVVTVSSDGTVQLALKYNTNLDCSMIADEFPFDTQHCAIIVGLWTYNYSEVVLHLLYPVNGLAPYNGDWNFAPVMGNASEFNTVSFDATENVSTIGKESYAELHYLLGLQRKPEYYVYVLLLPSLLLTSLCIIGTFTPNSNINERNERVTLGLTTLLSMAVILNIVSTEMPIGSLRLPLLGRFVLFEIVICSVCIFFSTIIIIGHQRSLSRGWKPLKLCNWIANMRTQRVSRGISAMKRTPVPEKADKIIDRHFTFLHNSFHAVRTAVESIDKRMQNAEEKEHNELIWQTFFDAADTVLLVLLLILNTVISYVIIKS